MFIVHQLRQAVHITVNIETQRADLVGEAGEDGAAGAAGEPEHERVVGRAALGAGEVVEEANAIGLVHLHVPRLKVEGEGPLEAREMRDDAAAAVGDERAPRRGSVGAAEQGEEDAAAEFSREPCSCHCGVAGLRGGGLAS